MDDPNKPKSYKTSSGMPREFTWYFHWEDPENDFDKLEPGIPLDRMPELRLLSRIDKNRWSKLAPPPAKPEHIVPDATP